MAPFDSVCSGGLVPVPSDRYKRYHASAPRGTIRPLQRYHWSDILTEQSKYIKTKPLHPSQRVVQENPEDGSCIFRIDVVINFEMYSVFMSYGPGVKIIYPRNAVMYMRDKLEEALKLYDSDVDSKGKK